MFGTVTLAGIAMLLAAIALLILKIWLKLPVGDTDLKLVFETLLTLLTGGGVATMGAGIRRAQTRIETKLDEKG